jgi:hypothetical protein
MTIIKESLDYLDMEGQLESMVSIDEYAAKMGPDHEVVTLSFIVKSELAGEDLVSWFERGYDFVINASLSEGELAPGKYVVFVELDRRSRVPQRVIELLSDLKTLTGIQMTDWIVQIDDKEYPVSEEIIREKVILNPNEYKSEKENETELNEMRVADIELFWELSVSTDIVRQILSVSRNIGNQIIVDELCNGKL